MQKRCIQTDSAPKAVGPYSQAVSIKGEWVFISGQLGIDPARGTLVEGGVVKEAEQAILNIKAIVTSAGGSLGHVVKTTVLLADIGDFKEVNEVYRRFFPTDPPARAAFQVAALPLQGKIEIEAIAVL